MIYTVTLNPAVDREYTVPSIQFDEVLRAGGVRVDAGGKGFNVSRMLATLGTTSTALGFVGGKSGEWLQDELNRFGIETDFIWISTETRTNTTVVTPTGRHYLKVNEKGPIISESDLNQLINQIEQLVAPKSMWVLAGSLPQGIASAFYADLIEMIQHKGGRVFLDTSGEALHHGCAAGPDWIKPNQEEAIALTGQTDLLKSIDHFRGRSIPNTIISMGKDGALVDLGGELRHFEPPKIIEANPIGAGDATVGGIVWGISQGLSPLDACRWGIACGAMAASKAGTDFGTREEIEALYSKVRVRNFVS